MSYYINPNLFFLFEKENLCLWNYGAHEHFEIEADLLILLKDIAQNKNIDPSSPLLLDLKENDIVREAPYPDIKWGWDRLSHLFHKGTQNVPELMEKRSKQEMIHDFIGFSEGYAHRKTEFEEQKHPPLSNKSEPLCLSQGATELKNLSFQETLQKRLTSRHFSGKSMSEQELSQVLKLTFGEIPGKWEGLEDDIDLIGVRKTSPSAGGIHSIQAYVTIFSVEGIPSGLYLYDAKGHTLELIHKNVPWEKLIHIMADQFYMEGLAFGVFMVSDLERVWAKYLHSRAYREIFLDAGHLSQTFQLTATSLSLETWISGYFRDDDLMDFLEISEENKAPLLFVGAGHGKRTPLHPHMVEALKEE